MFNFIGDFAIVLNYLLFITSFLSVFFYLKSISEAKFLSLARYGLYFTNSGIILISFILLLLIINHQYQYIYVFNNSSNDLPFGLLLSTFYAGQEGSFLFWLLCLVVIGIFLQNFTKKNGLESSVMSTFGIVVVFLLLLLINKSPFEKIWSLYPEAIRTGIPPVGANIINISSTQWVMIPPDGNGLNPLLQNFWMQIHPPVLFIGFALMTVPYAFAISSLIIGNYKNWIKYSLPWLSIASFFLGAGLVLGAFWAYETLGWGGYWGWDPVENSSLVPWIFSVALLHTAITQLKTGGLVKTNLFLTIITFSLVIYSTFLTRSGVLQDASVHSFTEPGSAVYLLLFIFLLSIFILGLGLLLYRIKAINSEKSEYNLISKEVMLSLGSIVLSLSALIILAGTSYPIFSKSAVDVSFYDKWNLPLAFLINIINGLSLVVGWGSDLPKIILKKIIISLLASTILTIISYFLGVIHFSMIILIWSSFFAIFINAEKLFRNIKLGIINLGGVFSHIGVALLLIGVIGSGKYSQTKHIELPLNEEKEVFGYKFKYIGEELFDSNKKSYFKVLVKNTNDETILKPIMFVNQMANGVMKIPDIKEMITKDIYFSPIGLKDFESNENVTNIQLKKDEPYQLDDMTLIFESYKIDMEKMMMGGEFSINASVKVLKNNSSEILNLSSTFDKNGPKYTPVKTSDGKYEFVLQRVLKDIVPLLNLGYVKLTDDITAKPKEILVADISIKPAINLFWLGNLLMLFGFILAYIRRKREVKNIRD